VPLQTENGGMPACELNGICFPMKGTNAAVPVRVSSDALQDVDPSEIIEQAQWMDRFYANRDLFESIASKKFDAGNTEADGSVLITSTDLKL